MITAIVIQARMSSSRFPGKMLQPIGGLPLAVYVCTRASRAKSVDAVVLATSEEPSDDPLAEAVAAAGFKVFRGSLDDVLSRFAGAARLVHADVAVRVTGDCPLVDPALLDTMLAHFTAGHLDYLSNIAPPTFPDGLDLEIMRVSALERAVREASPGHQREHVTPYLRESPRLFRLGNHVHAGADLSRYSLTVDRPADLALINDVIAATGERFPRLDAVIAVLEKNPTLKERATVTSRNEGSKLASGKEGGPSS